LWLKEEKRREERESRRGVTLSQSGVAVETADLDDEV